MPRTGKNTLRAWGLMGILCGVLIAGSAAAARAQAPAGEKTPPKRAKPQATQQPSDGAKDGSATPTKRVDHRRTEIARFTTADGVKIVGDYYPPKAMPGTKAPVAILIHMHPADRTSWKPLIPHLHDAGFAVLAYDIRGTGDSTEPADRKLSALYEKGDPDHFKKAYLDTAAAKAWLAKRSECDVSRIALVGASIGCSISLQYASTDEAVKGVVCLSPGTNYFGVDSKAHIRACGKRAILLMSPEGEFKRVKDLVAASGGVAKSKAWPGGRDRHGTWMFDAPYGAEVLDRIVSFISGPILKPDPKAAGDAAEKAKP